MKITLTLLLGMLTIIPAAFAQKGGASIDPFFLTENLRSDEPLNNSGNYDLTSHNCRTDAGGISCVPTINPAQKTLVLIMAGDSQGASVGPSAYVPTNLASIDNLNVYDGALYADLDPLPGQTQSTLGVGSIGPRLADTLISNSIFNRVILVPISIGGSTSAMWAPGGVLYDRACVAMRRLAARGITPATTGVTFAIMWHLGENDFNIAQSVYQANVQAQTGRLVTCNAGSVRQFINSAETIIGNTTYSAIATAQATLVASGAPYYAGANLDSLTGATYRQADGTHFTTAGQAAAASLEYTAMHASGSPF